MATLIDVLVVRLQLNTQGFSQGTRQAAQQLAAFQRQLNQTGTMAQQTSHHLNTGLRGVTTNFNNLTAAALAAWTVLKTVQATLKTIAETQRSSELAAYGSAMAGVRGPSPANTYQAIANAMYLKTGAPVEATQGFMSKIARDIAGVQHFGEKPSEALLTLNRMGVAWDRGEAEMMRQLASVMAKMGPAGAQAAGTRLGQNPLLAHALYLTGTNFDKEVDAARRTSVTEKQTKAAIELLRAYRELEKTVEHFFRSLLEDNEFLVTIIRTFDRWLKQLMDSPEAMNVLKLAVEALAYAFGFTLVAAIGRAVLALSGFLLRFMPLIAAIAGALILIPDSALSPELVESRKKILKMLGDALKGDFGGFVGGMGGGDTPAQARRRAYQEWAAATGGPPAGSSEEVYREWLKDPKAMAATEKWIAENPESKFSGPATGPATPGRNRVSVPRVDGMTEDERNFLGLVLQHESSGGQNILNYEGRARGLDPRARTGYTAQGYYQVLNSHLHGPLGQSLGLSHYSHVMELSLVDQTRLALALSRGPGGRGHWIGNDRWRGNAALRAAVARGDRARPGPDEAINASQIPPIPNPDAYRRGATRNQVGGGTNNYGDANFGNIYAMIPSGANVTEYGQAVTQAIRDAMVANKTNTGLQ